MYADRLSQVSKSELYAQAAKKPYINSKEADRVFFDNEFTKLYKSLEVQVLNSVTKGDEDKEKVVNHDSIVTQYKEVIRLQDQELSDLRSRAAEFEKATTQLEFLTQQVSPAIVGGRLPVSEIWLRCDKLSCLRTIVMVK